MAPSTSWTRHPRTQTAFRGQDLSALTLRSAEGRWLLSRGSEELILEAGADVELEAVIAHVDFLFPPEGWTVDLPDLWRRGSWTCAKTPDGWFVSGPSMQVKQRFLSADRARKWVDLRIDRPGGLRGPRTRESTASRRTLPDVRVTDFERAEALALAARLEATYAAVVRASLKLVQSLIAEGTLSVRVSAKDEVLFSLTPRTGL